MWIGIEVLPEADRNHWLVGITPVPVTTVHLALQTIVEPPHGPPPVSGETNKPKSCVTNSRGPSDPNHFLTAWRTSLAIIMGWDFRLSPSLQVVQRALRELAS